MTSILFIIVYYAGAMAAFLLIARWGLGIDSMLKNNKAQIGLMILMAKKQGATTEEIDAVVDKVYGKRKTREKPKL